MVARAGEAAGFPFLVHSHMLRHSCGYKLANDGHDTRAIQHYLGHRSIASTVRYTALAPDRPKTKSIPLCLVRQQQRRRLHAAGFKGCPA
jgi:site-specific recombinase XerD